MSNSYKFKALSSIKNWNVSMVDNTNAHTFDITLYAPEGRIFWENEEPSYHIYMPRVKGLTKATIWANIADFLMTGVLTPDAMEEWRNLYGYP